MSKKLEPSMTKKMKEAASCNDWRSETWSIFKVPVGLRWINFETYYPKEIRNGPYDPKYVSIGPYHHGVEGLQPMEEFKWRAFDILTSESNTSIEACIDKMENLEKQARSCYFEEIKMRSEDFVQMMLVDVCFVLMVLTDRLDELETKKGNNNYGQGGGRVSEDELETKKGNNNNGQGGGRVSEVLSKNVLTDLLMLENQIPFFILREFFQLLIRPQSDYWERIEEAALDSLRSAYPGYKYDDEALINETASKDNVVYHHLLHLFCVSIVHPLQKTPQPKESTNPIFTMANKFKEKMKGVLPNCPIRSNDDMLPPQMLETQNMNLAAQQLPKVSKNPIFTMANKFKEKMKGILPNSLIRANDDMLPSQMFETQNMNLAAQQLLKVSKNQIFTMANKFNEKMKGVLPNSLIWSNDDLLPMFANQRMIRGDAESKKSKWIPSVTELEGFGVKFKAKEAKSFMNLEFRGGVMEIPSLILYPYTKTIFHNIIAFEQCFTKEVQPQMMAHISHYVMLMDFLIGNTSDIVTLQEKGIITNWLGSQDEVVRVFNQLRRGVIDFSRDYFSNIYSEVNTYRQQNCPKWCAKLKLEYCNSPWSCMSVTAAVALLLLTAVQTIFSLSPILHFLSSPRHT